MPHVDVPPGEAEALIDLFGIDALCDAIEEGSSLRSICAELGVARGSLNRWIAQDEERTRRVNASRIASAEADLESAEEGIANARTPFQLAKARELGYHKRWKASKTDPRRYGDKLAVGGAEGMPPIDHNLTVRFVTPA